MHKKRILIVDDEPDFVEMVQMRLEANNYEVLAAHDGKEGLAKAESEKPDLMLLDVMMPGMDGFQVLRRVRKSPALKDLPVVMLTAKGETKSIFKAQDMGITDYLIKPLDSQDLLDTMRRYA